MSETVETLRTLVAFPTVSRDSNMALIDWVADRLAAAGAAVRLFPNDDASKASLLATIGPAGGDGVVLSGHSDVVPVEGQPWTSDPFVLTEREDGRLYARGASDMKGFIAAMLTLAGKAKGRRLARPLHLAVSYDEEIGCVGIRPMLSALVAEGFRAAGCIIGEPTEMQIGTGHKGKVAGCICCRGLEAHSSNPLLGLNAIHLGAGMVQEAILLQERLAGSGARDAHYPVPHTTVHVGTIRGGSALNIVPGSCDLEFELRLVPPDDADALVDELRRAGERLAAPGKARGMPAGVEIAMTNAYPGLDTDCGAGIVSLARAATGRNDVVKLAFGTEAGLYQKRLGMPTIVCGPGSIARAHKADEYVTRDELATCDVFLERVLEKLSA
ncbi:MAG: acetylornithine deacetylase [Alphaproteobacteria bacterium]|nr:acetylornithine deacetylase [Alphaproteobacteria bacterium]